MLRTSSGGGSDTGSAGREKQDAIDTRRQLAIETSGHDGIDVGQ